MLLLKGFDQPSSSEPYLERAVAWAPRTLQVSDSGSDVTAYRAAAHRLSHRRICFLNSFSEIAAPTWLERLETALSRSGVGAAGATGSWGSHLSYNMFQAGWGGQYARAFPSRRHARRAMHALSDTQSRGEVPERVYAARQALRDVRAMPPFPSAHLRTNAFLVDRERFAGLRFLGAGDKRAAYRFESGRRGLTAQLRAAGRRGVIVDRMGDVHDERAWDRADVFWQSQQDRLLVHDNQTRAYAAAPADVRAVLSAFAWGRQASPAPGGCGERRSR